MCGPGHGQDCVAEIAVEQVNKGRSRPPEVVSLAAGEPRLSFTYGGSPSLHPGGTYFLPARSALIAELVNVNGVRPRGDVKNVRIPAQRRRAAPHTSKPALPQSPSFA